MQYRIEKYNSQYYVQWNAFVEASKNGTFLFHRDFMEYHADRFEDYSLMVFEGEKLLTLLPANKVGNELHSHDGLTYGGLVYNSKIKLSQVIRILQAILKYLNDNAFTKLYLKLVPPIYHKQPAQEQDYALFVAGAKLVRKDSLSVCDLFAPLGFSKDRKQCIRRGEKYNLKVIEETDFSSFWTELLIPTLQSRHNALPVHSLEEITSLHKSFPENIRQFNVYLNNEIVAGTTVFVTGLVAHSQYIAGNPNTNRLGGLDLLHHHLINKVFADKKYFDFGISNEDKGMKVNENLGLWKESFGARTIVHDFYEVDTQNYKLLESVLI